jgi:hypothetical protein
VFLSWQFKVRVVRSGRAGADLHSLWNKLYTSVNLRLRPLTKNLRTSFLTTPRSALHFNVKTFTRVKNYHHHARWHMTRLCQWSGSISHDSSGNAKGDRVHLADVDGGKVANFCREGTVGRYVNKLFQNLIDLASIREWQTIVLYSAR